MRPCQNQTRNGWQNITETNKRHPHFSTPGTGIDGFEVSGLPSLVMLNLRSMQ
jgi:hypothetical protein